MWFINKKKKKTSKCTLNKIYNINNNKKLLLILHILYSYYI